MTTANKLLDTNILIYLLKGDLVLESLVGDDILHYSFVSEIELRSIRDYRKQELEAIRYLMERMVLHEYNQDIKEKAIMLRTVHHLKLADALVGATAWSTQMPLLTADKKFGRISEFQVVLYTPVG